MTGRFRMAAAPSSLTGSALTAMLIAFMMPAAPFTSPVSSAMAMLALLWAVVFDGTAARAPDEWRGLRIGLPLGFFLRQAWEFPALARGAENVVALSGVVWLVALGVAVWRRRRSQSL